MHNRSGFLVHFSAFWVGGRGVKESQTLRQVTSGLIFSGLTNGSWYTLASGGVGVHSALLHQKSVQLPARETHKRAAVNQAGTMGDCGVFLFIARRHA